MRNIGHLCTRRNSQTWGQDAWKKVVVCIISDGRKKIHPRVLDCLTALGVYQNGNFMKNMVNNKPVTAHVFEYTASFGLDENLHFRYPDKGIVPTQILFCLKEKNLKKINSHRWFFNAFAPLLKVRVFLFRILVLFLLNLDLYDLKAKRLCSYRRRDPSRSQELVLSLENFRPEFKCCRCLW